MPRQLHLEGPALEPLLEQARADHGATVTVVGAHRVRRGGFAGFFAREHYEVTVEVPDPTERPADGPAGPSGPVRSTGAETLEELLALADRADGAGALADARARAATAPVLARPDAAYAPAAVRAAAATAVGSSLGDAPSPARVPGRTLSTETRGFDEVLAALRADLLGPGSTDALDRRYESSVDRADLPAVTALPVVPTGAPATVEGPLPGAGEAPADLVARPDVTVRHDVSAGPGVPAARTPATPAPATPWQPATVLEDLTEDLAEDLAQDEQAEDLTEDLADEHADAVRSTDVGPGADLHLGADRAHLTGELVGLALAVGAGRALAAAAAADAVASGATDPRHLVPLLASALADHLPVLPAAGAGGTGAPGGARTDRVDDAVVAGAGEVVVVLGAPDRVDAAAADVAARLGTPWLARWSDEPAPRRKAGGTALLSETRALPALAGAARSAGLPLVVAVPDPTLADGVAPAVAGGGRAALLSRLDPDLVVLVVDADASPLRQQRVTDRVVAAHGARRPLVLALVGCEAAASPLAHTSTPVALLDGRPATAGTWTGVLLDALRAAAAR